MNMSKDSFEDSDYICSYGMKLTWDINDPKLPQVWDKIEEGKRTIRILALALEAWFSSLA